RRHEIERHEDRDSQNWDRCRQVKTVRGAHPHPFFLALRLDPRQTCTTVLRPITWIFPLLVLSGCKSSDDNGGDGGTYMDATHERVPFDARGRFCDLPGSLQFTASGKTLVPGGYGPDLGFLTIPAGFCVHYFATVGNVRQIKFAPSGELFAASPTTSTT